SRFKLLDFKSACFSACPAGVSDMALIASDLGADLKTTAVIHVVRLIYAIGFMPSIIALFITLIGG
ncbi:MAG: AbrB family transcriptional regulator, partial [Erysipelotrichaceae bacterium]|nr:AbrB family transcriptional regulator [Erysipelotrichaceae bacterium]